MKLNTLPRVANVGLCRDRSGGAGLTPMIQRLEEERGTVLDFIERTVNEAQTANRDLSETERASLESSRARVVAIDEQLTPMREFAELRDAHDDTARRYQSTGGSGDQQRGGEGGGGETRLGVRTHDREHQYRTAGEFLADGYRAAQRRDQAAVERLRSHGVTIENGQMVRAVAPHNTTAEVPGLLPTPIVGEIMSDVDAARPFITSIGARDLGGIPGTSFERPTVSQHVEVGKQNGEKTEVPDGQFKVTGVPFTKDTYGGWANVSRQNIDWTAPGVWDALMTDFIEQYGLQTENAAADDFAAAVTQTQELTTALAGEPTLQEVLKGLYGAAVKSYQGSGRLPDTIWASLDWWETLGVLVDYLKASTAGDGGGDSSATSFAGNLLRTPRIIVPSFPAGTLIVGVKSRTEVYEDRFGFLTAVEPKVFGVEIAYGGYMASGTIKPAAFTKIVNNA